MSKVIIPVALELPAELGIAEVRFPLLEPLTEANAEETIRILKICSEGKQKLTFLRFTLSGKLDFANDNYPAINLTRNLVITWKREDERLLGGIGKPEFGWVLERGQKFAIAPNSIFVRLVRFSDGKEFFEVLVFSD